MRTDSNRAPLRPTLLTRFFYVWVVLWGSLVTVAAAVGYLATVLLVRRPTVFRWWAKWWSRLIFLGAGIRLECAYLAPLDCASSYVFASNHQILLDIPLLSIAIDCPFGFVAKGELARVPFLGHAIRFSPSVFVDRSNPRDMYDSMKKAAARIQDGTSVIIFPEGARSYAKELGPFRKGTFSLALEAQVPIVPVTIVDAYEVFNEVHKMARPGVVRIVVGTPISLGGRSKADLPDVMVSVRDALVRPLQSDGAYPEPVFAS